MTSVTPNQSHRSCFTCPAFLFLVVVLTSCTFSVWRTSYSPEVEAVPSFSKHKDSPIYFSLNQLFERRKGNTPPFVDVSLVAAFERSLIDNPTFNHAIFISAQPEDGVYAAITIEQTRHLDMWSFANAFFSQLTLYAIPHYDTTIGYSVRYDLHKNHQVMKTYQYEVNQKSLTWVAVSLALLFVHDSWTTSPWTTDRDKAIATTARSFWLDASHDGFFTSR